MTPDHCRYGAHVAARAIQKAFLEIRRSWRAEPDSQGLSAIEVFRLAVEPLGIELRELGCGAFELRHGGDVHRFQEMTSDLENAFTYWLTGHKHMTFETLREAGISELPHDKMYSIRSIEEARRDFRERRRAVVVKPCFGTSGGQGVTVGITNEKDLRRAIYSALCHDRQFIVEDFVAGESFRLLFLDGRLLSALRRLPASVTGDGVATVQELIDRENARRSRLRGFAALYSIQVDHDVRRHLEAQGRSLRAVPAAGERVFLRSVSNFGSGGETEDVTDLVCDETVDLCRRIVKVLRIKLAGIDIITRDIGLPISETGGVINEVNTSPCLNLHYAVRNADKAKDVAREVLLDMFPSARAQAAAATSTTAATPGSAGVQR